MEDTPDTTQDKSLEEHAADLGALIIEREREYCVTENHRDYCNLLIIA